MPVSSLSNFTVPLSTNQTASTQGLLMPKLKFRFRVTLTSFGVAGTPSTELTKQVMNVTRPEITFEEIKLSVYNSTVKLAGKHSFTDIKLTVRDDVSNEVSGKVAEQMQKQFDFFEQASAASGIDYKFSTRIEILDGGNGAYTPNVLETFQLDGCWIKQVTYQGGDYASATDPLDIALSICYDNATQVDGAGNLSGLGETVGRTIRSLAVGG
jgi:hypothetical protein